MSENYCSAAELQTRLWGDTVTPSSVDELVLEQVIQGASRWIEKFTGRRFYASTETRYYTALFGNALEVDDLLSITTLSTDEDGDRTYEITWASTDYDLMPLNATADAQPYTEIRTAPEGDYSFPAGLKKGVKVVGSFGYCTIASLPHDVREACLLQSERVYKRKDAPFGIAGPSELGQLRLISELDPDVKAMLYPYVRLV